jgi:hypothetical protein
MWRSWLIVAGAVLGLTALGTAIPLGEVGRQTAARAGGAAILPLAKPDAATKARLSKTYGKLPLHFEANHGQTDGQVKFLSRGRGYVLFLTPTEAVLALKNHQSAISSQPSAPNRQRKEPSEAARTVLRMKLLGANSAPNVVGLDELPGKSHYFIGDNSKKWRTNIPHYSKVRYEGVYPGVDLLYYGTNQRQLEHDFVIAPGVNPGTIRLGFEGVNRLTLDVQGNLILHVAGGEVIQHAPLIYQQIGSVRKAVSGGYVLKGDKQVGFDVAAYDASRPLIIDPPLSYSTYLGGSADDQGLSIAVDAAGNAYVTGGTGSTNFPTTVGAFQPTLDGFGGDAFVTKLNAAGTAFAYSTYLGGSFGDSGDGSNGIAVDAAGNAYVTGETGSTDFPTTVGAFQPTLNGTGDVFVTKLNATGSASSAAVISVKRPAASLWTLPATPM